MNFFKLYIGDYQRDTAHLSVTEHGAYLLMLQHYYATEKPLPVGKALHRMLRAQDKAEREAIDSVASQFWTVTDAGLVNERADVEITKANAQGETNARIAREREAKRKAAREQHKQSTNRATNGQPNQTPDTRHQTKEKESARSIPPVLARAPDPDDPPEAQGQPPTPGGAICQAMRRAGLQATNPGDPRLLALIAQGATLPEFEGIAAEAVAKGKGWAWVLTVLPARRAEAAAISLAPAPQADPKAWLANRRGVIERGCAVGIGPWDESNAAAGTGPSWAEYRAQVIAADAAQTPQETAA